MLPQIVAAPLLEPGDGEIHCELGPYGKATLPVMRSRYPLKLLAPQAHQKHSALVYCLSYGGGLISGDCPSMRVRVKPGATLTMLSQGSTKVFKRRAPMPGLNGRRSDTSELESSTTFQRLDARVSEDAVLLQLPDPVTCFAGADFVQRQRFLLANDTSSLVLADWFTSGRHDEHGESWQFQRYDSAVELYCLGRLVLSDRTLLETEGQSDIDNTTTADVPAATTTQLPAYAAALEPYRCHATVIVYGRRVKPVAEYIRSEFAKVTITSTTVGRANAAPAAIRPHVWSMSDTRDGAGIILRAAATTTEQMRYWLRDLLQDVKPLCGDLVYERIFTS